MYYTMNGLHKMHKGMNSLAGGLRPSVHLRGHIRVRRGVLFLAGFFCIQPEGAIPMMLILIIYAADEFVSITHCNAIDGIASLPGKPFTRFQRRRDETRRAALDMFHQVGK